MKACKKADELKLKRLNYYIWFILWRTHFKGYRAAAYS